MAKVELPPIDAQDVARRSVTLEVEVRVLNMRRVKARLWLAVQICRVAAWVGGIGLEVNQRVGVIVTERDEKAPEGREVARQ